MITKIGVDLGNYDTKTAHTSTPSSYEERQTKDLLAEETIFYKGKYYNPTLARNNQQLDKTVDDYCLIMSLFAISKELIFRIKSRFPGYNNEQIQAEISKYSEINLGIGLPAGKFNSLAKKMVECYLTNWSNGCEFTYFNKDEGEIKFNFKLLTCKPFPQDYTAVAYNKKIDIIRSYKDYYIIGIGGGTVDIIPVTNGQAETNDIMTFEKGTTVLYGQITKRIQQETGKIMNYTSIESILRKEKTMIDEKRINIINKELEDFSKKLVDDIVHFGYQISDKPCIFIGGGALLLKECLEKNPEFVCTYFLDDVNANAYFYEALIGKAS